MKRYSIRGYQYGSDHESELCQCDSNPEPIAQEYAAKTLMIKKEGAKRATSVPKWANVRIVENAPS